MWRGEPSPLSTLIPDQQMELTAIFVRRFTPPSGPQHTIPSPGCVLARVPSVRDAA